MLFYISDKVDYNHLILRFGYPFVKNFQKIRNGTPVFRSLLDSVFAVLVLAVSSWNVTPANNEGRLYLLFSTYLASIENERTSLNLMCYYFKPSLKIKHIDIARHRYQLQIRGYEGFIAQRPQIGGHRDFNLCIYMCASNDKLLNVMLLFGWDRLNWKWDI